MASGYALLDAEGRLITVAPDAASAAAVAAERGSPNVWIENETGEGFGQEGLHGEQLGTAGRPSLKALQASTLPPLDPDAVMSISLREAHERLIGFFPASRFRQGKDVDVQTYDKPRLMARKLLGQNYKTAKQGDEKPENAEEYARIRNALRERYGVTQANVQGLSLVPHHLMLGSRGGDEFAHFDKFLKDVPDLPNGFTLCRGSTSECRAGCLVYAGQNSADPYNVRVKFARTTALLRDPHAFTRLLVEGIASHAKSITRAGMAPMFRLNVFSDIPWEEFTPWLFSLNHEGIDFSGLQFYDYTKVPGRRPPPNYDLTFSYAGPKNVSATRMDYEHGKRVAAVFLLPYGVKTARRMPLPTEWCGFPVIDGDISDMRPLDPHQVIVGLRWKVPARQKIDPGSISFVVRVWEQCGVLVASQSARQEPIEDSDADF